MKDALILALDIGTSSVRAALYDLRGDVLPETMVKNDRIVRITDDGGAELDAHEALEQVEKAIDDALEKSSANSSDIIAVAASCFWHSLVGVDADDRATTNVFGWADTRSRTEVGELRASLDETSVHNRTGARFHSSFWPAKLRWLANDSTNVFNSTDKWLSLSDYVGLKFFDSDPRGVPTSVSMASATGIFNLREDDWDDELLKFTGIGRDKLPFVAADGEAFSLNESYSKRWPRLMNAKWFPAIGDGAANNLGAGCMTSATAALMIGTSGAMRVAFRGELPETIPAGLWCYRIDHKTLITGGALSDGGGLYRWLKDTLKLAGSDDEIDAEIARREPDSHGLTFLPFLAGERSTGYHESAYGACLGLRASTDSTDIVQAALESVAYRFAAILERLSEVCPIRTIIASGGALRESPVWTQMISDVLGHDLTLPETREASSRGAVLLTLEQLGILDDVTKLPTPSGTKFTANGKDGEVYRAARRRHERFYDALINAAG